MGLIQLTSFLIRRRNYNTNTQQRGDLVKTQEDDGHLQAKEKDLRRNQPEDILSLDFKPPKL